MRNRVAIIALSLTAPLHAAPSAPFTINETGAGYYRLDDAVRAIG